MRLSAFPGSRARFLTANSRNKAAMDACASWSNDGAAAASAMWSASCASVACRTRPHAHGDLDCLPDVVGVHAHTPISIKQQALDQTLLEDKREVLGALREWVDYVDARHEGAVHGPAARDREPELPLDLAG